MVVAVHVPGLPGPQTEGDLMADDKKQPKKKATVTWKCPSCATTVEHGKNVTSHSHTCKNGSTVNLIPLS